MSNWPQQLPLATGLSHCPQVREECQQDLAVLEDRLEEVRQAQQELASTTGAVEGITGADLSCRLETVEQEVDQMQKKIGELDVHINTMLKTMMELANQGEDGMEYTVWRDLVVTLFLANTHVHWCHNQEEVSAC